MLIQQPTLKISPQEPLAKAKLQLDLVSAEGEEFQLSLGRCHRLDEVVLQHGDTRLRARRMEASSARWRYEKAVAEGRLALLVSCHRGGQFWVRGACLPQASVSQLTASWCEEGPGAERETAWLIEQTDLAQQDLIGRVVDAIESTFNMPVERKRRLAYDVAVSLLNERGDSWSEEGLLHQIDDGIAPKAGPEVPFGCQESEGQSTDEEANPAVLFCDRLWRLDLAADRARDLLASVRLTRQGESLLRDWASSGRCPQRVTGWLDGVEEFLAARGLLPRIAPAASCGA